MSDEWVQTNLGQLLTLEYGKSLPERSRESGPIPVLGSNGVVGQHSKPLVPGPGIVVGRKGTAGSVTWCEQDFFPIDTTYWVRLRDGADLDLRFAYLLLLHSDLPGVCAQTGVPGLNRDRAYEVPASVPSLPVQRRIVDLMEHLDTHLANLETEAARVADFHWGMAEALLDGHRQMAVAELAVSQRGLIGGPFGSDLTRKDYVPDGVPVIRGTNMSGWGKFIGGDFVYVSDEKASKLSRNVAMPGDIVFTQRGTLGQVAIVPESHEQFVVSQSQMRLRADPTVVLADFVYFHFARPSTVAGIQRQNTATANPHINLGILAKQTVPAPPLAEQERIVTTLNASMSLVESLSTEVLQLKAFRAQVLSTLLTREIEVPASYDVLLGAAS